MTRPLRALTATPILAASLFTASAVPPILPGAATCAAAGYTSRVALVVEHGDGRVTRLCIGFDGASITGEQILKASSVEYATASYGSLGDAVCQIDSEPASYPPSCWTTTSPYWAMFVSRRGGSWSGAEHGVSSETFGDGDAEGFRYDPQSGPAGTPPPAGTVCAVPAQASGNSPAAVTPSQAQSPTAPSSVATGAAQPSAGTSPSAAVIAAATPGTRARASQVASAAHPAAASGVNVALILASAALGALGGSAVARALRRRRQ